MKRHAQLVQFQEQGEEEKGEDGNEEGPEAEWEKQTVQPVDWYKEISRGRLCFKNSVSKTNFNSRSNNITETDRFHTCLVNLDPLKRGTMLAIEIWTRREINLCISYLYHGGKDNWIYRCVPENCNGPFGRNSDQNAILSHVNDAWTIIQPKR